MRLVVSLGRTGLRTASPTGIQERLASSTAVGRIAAIVALVGDVIVAAILLFSGGSSYTVTAQFQNASQLVTGNQVEVGGVAAGSIDGISLGPDGTALVKMTVNGDY